MNSKLSMIKNFIHYFYPTIIRGVINLFVVVPVSTYYLEPKDFGIVGIITVFSGLVVSFSSVGVGWVLGGNYYKISEEDRKELVFNTLLVGIGLRTIWVIFFGIGGFLFLSKFIKSYENIFILYFWLFLVAEWLNSIWEVVYYVIVLQKKGRIFAFLDITQALSNLFVLITCLVIFHLKTISLVLANLGSAIAGFLFSIFYIRKYIIMKIRIKWIKETVKLSLPVIPFNIFENISVSIDRFLIQRWISLSRLGIYTHSLSYKDMFMVPFKAFSRTYSPEVLESISNNDNFKIENAKSFLKKWFGLITIAGFGVVLFSKEVINILTHGKFVDAAPLVSLWFILILIYSFGVPYTQFFFAHKKMKFIIFSDMILGVFSWVLTALFVKFFGIMGATISVLLYYFTLHFVRKIYAMRLGCDNFEGMSFWICVSLLLGLIILNVSHCLTFVKVFIFLALSLIISLYFGLFNYLKNFKPKVF